VGEAEEGRIRSGRTQPLRRRKPNKETLIYSRCISQHPTCRLARWHNWSLWVQSITDLLPLHKVGVQPREEREPLGSSMSASAGDNPC
jgi:hypothetical protein